MRTYSVGDRKFNVPVDGEADIIAGINYLNNLRGLDGKPLLPGSFVNDYNGHGLNVIDASGQYVMQGGVPKSYSWEYLRAVGMIARAQSANSERGVKLTWRKPGKEKANLEPDWFESQRRYHRGDGSDAIIDPQKWGVDEDADEFADKAQRAADGEEGFSPALRQAIKRAQETGEPQFVDILLPGSGPLDSVRGLVLGQYGIRVRGVVIVKDGKYVIVGRAVVEDAGKFNYSYDGRRNRSALGKALLWLAPRIPDPTMEQFRYIGSPGREYSIRADRDADVQIWGVVR
jgi:hypothetical protein